MWAVGQARAGRGWTTGTDCLRVGVGGAGGGGQAKILACSLYFWL